MNTNNLPTDNLEDKNKNTSSNKEKSRKKLASLLSNKNLLRILAILIVITTTVIILIFWEQITSLKVKDLEPYGYLGAFLINLTASASIFLPVPGILLIAGLGAIFNPFLVGLAGGAGAALGETTGYLIGYSGQAIFEKYRIYQRVESWMKRWGPIVLFAFSAVPNPFFDIAGAAAGVLRFPLRKFLLVCFLGKVINCTVIALLGEWGFSKVLDLF